MEIRSAELRKNSEMMMTRRSLPGIAQPVKRTVLYFLAFIFTGMLVSWLFTMETDWGLSAFLQKLLFIIAFLIAGIIHVSTSPRVQVEQKADKKNDLLFPLLLALLVGIASLLVFAFTDADKKPFALLAACAFLLPPGIRLAWNYFDFVATPEPFKVWVLKTQAPVQQNVAALVSDLPIRIRLRVNYYDINEKSFKTLVPARITLGKMFHEFLIEQEAKSTNIELLDKDQKPFAWRFVLRRAFSSMNLDPDLTLAGNEVKPKDIIIAERVKISNNINY